MSDRVRAILIARDNRLLTIKRIKPGRAPYWVLPGGGGDRSDTGLEAALHREVREELAGAADIHSLLQVLQYGAADIHSLLQVLQYGAERHHIYLARIRRWNFADRSGPEFREAGRGEYVLDEVPLTRSDLARIDLVPPETAELLQRAVAAGTDLFELPDLRVGVAR
jgi:8-oxo-dGTP pyrophosphatase MutT (NUDIX family)